jgi:hypothetical protein
VPPAPRLKPETDPVSETLCFKKQWTMDKLQKLNNPNLEKRLQTETYPAAPTSPTSETELYLTNFSVSLVRQRNLKLFNGLLKAGPTLILQCRLQTKMIVLRWLSDL